jgi:Leucine-rich repeat (LRR) protein
LEWLGHSGTPGNFTAKDIRDRMPEKDYKFEVYRRNELINSLAGLEYFEGLKVFSCAYNNVTICPKLPSTLEQLYIYGSQTISLPELPAGLTVLYCQNNELDSLPALPPTLKQLVCWGNELTSLPSLPAGLTVLDCGYNQLQNLPALPATLEHLTCSGNQLTSLPALPDRVTFLSCSQNKLRSLPALPAGLEKLYCYRNELTSLPALPGKLTVLDCFSNKLRFLPALPPNLEYLDAYNNDLLSLPELPSRLETLDCSENQISSLPDLPANLSVLLCYSNNLTELPALPQKSLWWFRCDNNDLSSLDNLPDTIKYMDCSNNKLTSLPDLPAVIKEINCHNNYLNIFADPLKSKLAACPAAEKRLSPQFRLVYTGDPVQLIPGDTLQLKTSAVAIQRTINGWVWNTVAEADFTKLEFYSSNEDVARIDATGLITAVNKGDCEIKAALSGVVSEFSSTAIPVTVKQFLSPRPGSITLPGDLPGTNTDPIPLPGDLPGTNSRTVSLSEYFAATHPNIPLPPGLSGLGDSTMPGTSSTGDNTSPPGQPVALTILMTIDNPVALVNNTPQTLDVPPMIIEGRTMVPIRFIGEAFGAQVDWLEEIRTVVITLDGQELRLVIGQTGPGLDVPAQIINGRAMVPIRFISESLGGEVTWYADTRTVKILR